MVRRSWIIALCHPLSLDPWALFSIVDDFFRTFQRSWIWYGYGSKPCTPGEHQNSWDSWMWITTQIWYHRFWPMAISPISHFLTYPAIKHCNFENPRQSEMLERNHANIIEQQVGFYSKPHLISLPGEWDMLYLIILATQLYVYNMYNIYIYSAIISYTPLNAISI